MAKGSNREGPCTPTRRPVPYGKVTALESRELPVDCICKLCPSRSRRGNGCVCASLPPKVSFVWRRSSFVDLLLTDSLLNLEPPFVLPSCSSAYFAHTPCPTAQLCVLCTEPLCLLTLTTCHLVRQTETSGCLRPWKLVSLATLSTHKLLHSLHRTQSASDRSAKHQVKAGPGHSLVLPSSTRLHSQQTLTGGATARCPTLRR